MNFYSLFAVPTCRHS